MAVATNDSWKYKPGQVIVSAFPLVYSLSKDTEGFCSGCFKSIEEESTLTGREYILKQCANCQHFKYCSPECQKSDWKKFHKLGECRIYAKHGSKITSNFARFALRLLLLHQKRPEQLEKLVKLIDGNERSFYDLKDHIDEIKNHEQRVQGFIATFSLFNSIGLQFDSEILFKIFCKLCINSFSILDTSLNEIGTGLYIETSIFDHSCQPNSAPVFNGLHIEIRSLKNVPLGDPVTINYVDMKASRSTRQGMLKAQYYFTCQCPRCTNEGESEDASISNEIADLDKKYDELVNAATGSEPNVPWNECYVLLIQTLPLYEAVYGQYHPDFTVQLMRCVKTRSNIPSDGSEALNFLVTKFWQAVQVTHGREHPLYRQFKESFNCD